MRVAFGSKTLLFIGFIIGLIGGVSALAAASATPPTQRAEKILHVFHGGSDGAQPSGGLIADNEGNLYGATEQGGTGTNCNDTIPGCGTVFEIAKGGGETVLYSFQGESDGASPSGSLLMDDSGNLYGSSDGGAGTNCDGYGCGTVFKLTPGGTESVLYTFQGGSDGEFPQGSLIADQSGNLYGLTVDGGSYKGSECAVYGCGTVFEVQPNGSKVPLYAFEGGSDGGNPIGGLVADASGNLYGATEEGGGSGCGGNGCGTVFKVAPGGTETVLYAFQGYSDGQFPEAGLIADNAGNLYGTTEFGGVSGAGTVFEVTPEGQKTVLYSFAGGSDGANPEAGLIMDGKGNLYGTTDDGGGTDCKSDGCGTAFELTAKGREKVLYRFQAGHGRFPEAPLLLGAHGGLYGTTTAGAKYKVGVVFELKK